MFTFIFRAATIIPTLFKATRNTVAKCRTKNDAIVPTDPSFTVADSNQTYGSPQNSVILKESSTNEHQVSSTTKDYELQLVQKIKGIMTASKTKGYVELEELIMVDVLQRLGLEYYFQDEIQAVLESLHAKFFTFEEVEEEDDDKFYEIALSFRLLRQYGYYIPADIYNIFKDKNGNFKEKHCKDVKTLLCIYESCQLSTPAEHILCDASNFCGQLLQTLLKSNVIEQSQAKIIENTLRNPCHKSSPRLFAKNFLEFDVSLKYFHEFSDVKYQWMNEVQALARIDFGMAHMTYRNEIQQISRWAKQLDLDKDLGNFARIQPFKWCMWSLGIIPGPNMSEQRLEIAKVVSFIYMVDDIFDSHQRFDELYLFTEAVIRWEQADTRQLTKPMKVCFNALVDTTKDFSTKIQRKYAWNPEQCLRKLWVEQFQAYLLESKWSFAKYLPTTEEYLNNAIVTSGTHIALAHVFFLMGRGINNNGVQELSRLPPIIYSTATILRLWNDAGIHMDRTPNGNDGSYLDCYMNERKDTTLENARGHVKHMISNAWQSLNEEYMSPISPFSKDFKMACLNLARMVPIMYSHDMIHHLRYVMEQLISVGR